MRNAVTALAIHLGGVDARLELAGLATRNTALHREALVDGVATLAPFGVLARPFVRGLVRAREKKEARRPAHHDIVLDDFLFRGMSAGEQRPLAM